MLFHFYIRKQVYNISQTTFIQFWTSEVLRQNILQTGILLLYKFHRCINRLANFRRMRGCRYYRPACITRNKEYIFGRIFIFIFLITTILCNKFIILFFKLIRNVFKKD